MLHNEMFSHCPSYKQAFILPLLFQSLFSFSTSLYILLLIRGQFLTCRENSVFGKMLYVTC